VWPSTGTKISSWKLASQAFVHIAQLIQTAIAKNIFYKDTSTRICNDHTIISKTTSDISIPILMKICDEMNKVF
jgi:hypothetical protein